MCSLSGVIKRSRNNVFETVKCDKLRTLLTCMLKGGIYVHVCDFLKIKNRVLETVLNNVMKIKVFPSHHFLDSNINLPHLAQLSLPDVTSLP